MREQMIQAKTPDKYGVTLQRYDSEERLGQYRVLAERMRDGAVIEAELSNLQICGLLLHAHNGHQPSVDESLNQFEVDGQTVIRYDPTNLILFTLQELIRFGFDPEKFEALPS